jgi:hypothetical protein
MSLKAKLRALVSVDSPPEYEMQPAEAYTVRQSPEKGGGSVHVASISFDAYRIVISGGQHPSAFTISKHDAAAMVAILRKIEGK